MTKPEFRFELLNATHDRTSFRCGVDALDRYLQTQATQDMRRRMCNCFVALDNETGETAGCYTLSAASIPTTDLPTDVTKRLPRYPAVPAVRIGRLAVATRFQGRGLGAVLLWNAFSRTVDADAAAFAVLVDAKDDKAVSFYRHHGFLNLLDRPRNLYVPLATLQDALRG